MRIAVTGKHGQLAQALSEVGPGMGVTIVPLGRPELDLAQPATVEAALFAAHPDVIVSAAAYTAVDRAEGEPDLAFAVNAAGAGAVAQAAADLHIPVIHISTDYVFAGDKSTPYVEDDPTGPLSVYGHSKLVGEQRVAAAAANHVILRTSWVYSPFGSNFLRTMLRLAESRDTLRVVADQYGSPTSALDIADAVIRIAERLKADADPKLRGIFHFSAGGVTNWADFAREIFNGVKEGTGKCITVEAITTAEYPTAALRPANSKLESKKLARLYGISAPDWRASAQVVLDRVLKGKQKGTGT